MDMEEIKKRAAPLFRERGFVLSAALFGSSARGEQTEESDVDFLLDLDARTSLFDLGELKVALEEALGTSVDVVSGRGLKPRMQPHVLRDRVIVYEKR